MGKWEVFVSGVPRPQGSMTLARDPRTGREFAKYSSPTLEWRRTCYVALGEWWDGAPPLQGPVEARYEFLFPRPKAHRSAKGGFKASAPYWYWGNTNDVDKLCRALNDAMTDSGVWNDDGQVVRLLAEKRYIGPDERSGVQIVIEQVEEPIAQKALIA